jgi:hypothetical protein
MQKIQCDIDPIAAGWEEGRKPLPPPGVRFARYAAVFVGHGFLADPTSALGG